MKTLNLINQVREEFSLEALTELPKGIPSMKMECPIAQSLKEICPDVSIDFTVAHFDSMATAAEVGRIWGTKVKYHDVVLPRVIKKFIKDFDAGKYPQYSEGEISL